MVKLSDLKKKPPKIILYGPAGSGKTAFVSTIGKDGYLIDIDGGIETARTLKDDFFETRQGIEVLPCAETDVQRPSAYRLLKTEMLRIFNEVRKGTFEHKVLIIESLTSLSDSLVRYIMGNSNMLYKPPQMQQHLLISAELDQFLLMVYSIKIPVVLTAHQMVYTVDNKQKMDIAVSGQRTPSKVLGYFDEVLRAKVQNEAGGKVSFQIVAKPTASQIARSRSNIPPLVNSNVGLKDVLLTMGYDIDQHEINKPDELKKRKEEK